MGINVGAFLAPVVAEFVQGRFGFHPAFAVAAGGMAISVSILWKFKRHIDSSGSPARCERSNGRGRKRRRGRCAASQRQPSGCRAFEPSGYDGSGAGMETDRRAHRHLPDRDRLLDGVPPERLDADLLGEREHRLESHRHHLERDQPRLGDHPDVPAGGVLALARSQRPGALHAGEDGDRDVPDRRRLFRPLHRRREWARPRSPVANPYNFRVSPLVAARSLRRADAGRTDAVADGPVARLESRADPFSRRDDGRLVHGHGDRQQAHADRRALGRLAALDLLAALERPGGIHGLRAAYCCCGH